MSRRRPSTPYVSTLNEILDRVYIVSDDLNWSWKELAFESKLSLATIYALGNRERRFPRITTVLSLVRAVGLQLSVTQQKQFQSKRA